jgi:polysaccharide biosynthesis transport protein
MPAIRATHPPSSDAGGTTSWAVAATMLAQSGRPVGHAHQGSVIEEESELDLRGLLHLLRRRAWVIALCAVLGVVAGMGISTLQPTLYAATAEIRIIDPNAESLANQSSNRLDREREVNTQIEMVKSVQIREAVDGELAERTGQIESVSVSGRGNTDIIAIRVTSESPEVAQLAANAYAAIYVANRQEQVASAFTKRADEFAAKADELSEQIAQIDIALVSGPTTAEADALAAQRTSLVQQQADLRQQATEFELEATSRSGNVAITEQATLPTEPFSPNTARNVIVLGGLGLLVGMGLAFLLERLDDRVDTADRAERVSGGLPVLGSIPRKGRRSLDGPRELVEAGSPSAEAYRSLATSLRFSSVATGRRVLAITSAVGGEGKSTVAANLAIALAESGQRVVVVSADLRKPVLAGFFGKGELDVGLTSVLLGDATLNDALVPIKVDGSRGLYLLPSGPLPHNPTEMLSSSRATEVIANLREAGADFVLVDSPPVLPVADTLAITQLVDGMLVVVAAGESRDGNVARTVAKLRSVQADLVGLVLNGVSNDSSMGEYRYERAVSEPPSALAPLANARKNGGRSIASDDVAKAGRRSPVTDPR